MHASNIDRRPQRRPSEWARPQRAHSARLPVWTLYAVNFRNKTPGLASMDLTSGVGAAPATRFSGPMPYNARCGLLNSMFACKLVQHVMAK